MTWRREDSSISGRGGASRWVKRVAPESFTTPILAKSLIFAENLHNRLMVIRLWSNFRSYRLRGELLLWWEPVTTGRALALATAASERPVWRTKSIRAQPSRSRGLCADVLAVAAHIP